MRILFATDGSEGAKAGADFLRLLPLTENDHIALVTVVQTEESKADAKPILDAAQEAIGPTKATVHRYTRHGNAALEIIDAVVLFSEEFPTDLIIVGTRGLSGIARFFLGSVASRIARYAPCPVLVARNVHGPIQSVIAGYDGSRSARRAVHFLEKMPLSPDAKICLATMLTPASASGFLPGPLQGEINAIRRAEERTARKELAELAAEFGGEGRAVEIEVRDGDPPSGLLRIAAERNADLITVGAQGASEVQEFLLGSVSEKVLRHAPCSVLLVRPLPGTE